MMNDAGIAVGLFVVLGLALEGGFRIGRWTARDRDLGAAGQVGAIQGAVLGLLGLLLAFSFSAAAQRFLERQDLITQEANAIGTAYLRAELLAEPHRAELRAALKHYTERRIEVSATMGNGGVTPAALAEVDMMHGRIWAAARDGVEARPDLALVVLNPVNETIDLHSTRIAAGKKRLPLLVLGLLIATSAIAIADIGYGCGLGGSRRAPLTLSLLVLVGTFLWITIDLDNARSGLLMLNDAPLKALVFDAPSK